VRCHSRRRSDHASWLVAAALAGGCGFAGNSAKPAPDAGVDVPVGTVDAAPPDMAPGGELCFGPTGWQVCLDAPPSGAVTLTGALDTDKSDAENPCRKDQPASWTAALQPDACFVVGAKVTVTSLVATGKRPLVIVGGSAIAITTLLDVGSRHVGAAGAGANSTECQLFKRNPGTGTGGGGGAGGSFGGQAGNGGQGNAGNRQNGQAADADVGDPARLRGGCPGQAGGNSKAGDGGNGGGAVYLVSGGTITIMGAIDASGAGGLGAAGQNGGSGGGSGGLIVLHGAAISTMGTTLVFATGGGGGGGGAASGPPATAKGNDGQDPSVGLPLAIAAGGTGGQVSSGNGGDGGSGFPATGNTLDGTGGDTGAGGGGGGGASGFILTGQSLGLATVSPAAHTLSPVRARR
jgi:hypothetical protein